MNSRIMLFLKGLMIGMAETIPGVSGGTIAFITGIYRDLIEAIKSFDGGLIRLLLGGKFSEAFVKVNGLFLLNILIGMVAGLGIGIFAITSILEYYPEILWAFFFGLIIGSIIYMGRLISRWNALTVVAIIIGMLIAYMVTIAMPVQGFDTPWYVFLCGAIAICALILPGISGSFMLLILGMYSTIIHTVKTLIVDPNVGDLVTMSLFAGGAIIGLISFSRIVSWTYQHYTDATLALMTGFMVGSLNKIWPWRNPTLWMNEDDGSIIAHSDQLDTTHLKLLSDSNVWFQDYIGNPYTIQVLIGAVIGFSLVFVIDRMNIANDPTP